jgi:hypothetical protein
LGKIWKWLGKKSGHPFNTKAIWKASNFGWFGGTPILGNFHFEKNACFLHVSHLYKINLIAISDGITTFFWCSEQCFPN